MTVVSSEGARIRLIVREPKRVEAAGKLAGLAKSDGDEDGSVLTGRPVVRRGESLGRSRAKDSLMHDPRAT
jgi:hypothetical protein